MLDTKQLEAFYKAAQLKSFDKAAQQLNITPSAVSQRIKTLEIALSTTLFDRGSQMELTLAGEVLLRYANQRKIMDYELLQQFNPAVSNNKYLSIAVGINADSLSTWWSSVIPNIVNMFEILPEMIVDDQEHTLELLEKGEVVGCISTYPTEKAGLTSKLLGYMEYTCVASHTFVSRYLPNGFSAQSLSTMPAVVYNKKDALHDDMIERVFHLTKVSHPKIYVPSPDIFVESIVQSCGYGMVPTLQVKQLLHDKTLIDLTPQHHTKLPLYWCHWGGNPNCFKS